MRINFVSPFGGFTGYSIFARNLAVALERIGVEVTGIPDDAFDPKMMTSEVMKIIGRSREKVDLSIPCVRLSSAFPWIMSMAPGNPRIGYTMFEVDRVPPFWVGILNQMDRVWTPSTWGKGMLESSGVTVDVKVIPGGADVDTFTPDAPPFGEKEGVRPDTFKFLYVGKWERRKNTENLIRVFAETFKPDERVELWMEWFNPFDQFDPYQRAFDLNLPPHAPITFLQQFPDAVMPRVYRSADAFVLPTRGEGFGLPVAEAMAAGLCPIVPDTTSLADFVTKDHAYVIKDLGLEDVGPDRFFDYVPGARWHTPDLAHLGQLMRYAFEHPQETKEKGLRASSHMKKSWSWTRAAEVAKRELEAVA